MKINSLTSTRAIAAIMVVIHHYGSELSPYSLCGNLFHSGNLAVGYFFVLSGFVLFISHTGISYFRFIKHRLSRIAPAYFTALLMMVLVLIFYYPPPDNNIVQQILYSSLFIQSFFPSYVLELNSPAWSVSVEMFFYLLFPFLLLITDNKKFFFLTIVAYALSQAVHIYYAPKIWELTGSGIYFNPLIHLNQFLLGILGGKLFIKYPEFFRRKYWAAFLLAILIVLISIRPAQVSFQAGLIAPFFILLILFIASNDYKWLRNNILVFLGEISFGIYIYQMPVFKYLLKMDKLYWHLSKGLLFYSAFAILIIVAIFSYYFIEKPVRKLIGR